MRHKRMTNHQSSGICDDPGGHASSGMEICDTPRRNGTAPYSVRNQLK